MATGGDAQETIADGLASIPGVPKQMAPDEDEQQEARKCDSCEKEVPPRGRSVYTTDGYCTCMIRSVYTTDGYCACMIPKDELKQIKK